MVNSGMKPDEKVIQKIDDILEETSWATPHDRDGILRGDLYECVLCLSYGSNKCVIDNLHDLSS
jgi:hypothetical protein